ncbi:hypothetical protein IWQ60_012357 [Tieghemiomyces parasiticus]|uniref:DUF3421 domain-containing protein n=1 Tax=Tieghemiomyces parasiticus TaxID=78921 RepID=A0A9W7ZLU9_9FUNG|nr:hypothetical protein IWQ60_012357 [Tieghemiomyces parasiticus]
MQGNYGNQGQGQFQQQQGGHNGPQLRNLFQWVPASNGTIPPNAVQGGREGDGKPLYIARAFYKGGLQPGKAAPHLDGAYIAYDGKEVQLKEYFVLCGPGKALRWVACHGSVNFAGANVQPVSECHEESGEPLFIAKASYDGGEQIGKAGPHLRNGMVFGYADKERSAKEYFVLAYEN